MATVRAEKPRRLTVRWAEALPAGSLVTAELASPLPPGDYTLEGSSHGALAEAFQDGGQGFLVIAIDRDVEPGAASYLAEKGEPKFTPMLRDHGSRVDVFFQGKLFTNYVTDEPSKPYYFPVIGPTDDPYTRAYPMVKTIEGEDKDHPHQRSMWFTHGNVNGFDFWASDPINKPNAKFGSIKETSRTVVHNGLRAAVLRTTDDWLGPDGKTVCEDQRTVLFAGTDSTRVIDFDITIKAREKPVTFGDTKEGMFGLRLASSMDVKAKKGGKITNAEGVTDNTAWGKASPWVDYTGPVDGQTVGIAILNHPESFRYPTTWHVRDYGLFAANPFGWHDFGRKESGEYTIPEGQSIRFKYRVFLHKGETEKAHIPAAFQAFAKPPKVEVQAD
jgi:hypothetical protein